MNKDIFSFSFHKEDIQEGGKLPDTWLSQNRPEMVNIEVKQSKTDISSFLVFSNQTLDVIQIPYSKKSKHTHLAPNIDDYIEPKKKIIKGEELRKNPDLLNRYLRPELVEKFKKIVDEASEEEKEYLEIFFNSEINIDKLEAILELMDLFEVPEDISLEETAFSRLLKK